MWDNRLQQQTNWMDCFVVAVYYAPQSDQEVYCFIHKMSHQLARNLFLAMMLHQQGLEKKQRLLGRFVNIGTDLFAMAASCSHAALLVSKNPADQTSVDLADLFCLDAAKRVHGHFRTLFKNYDPYAYKIAQKALEGKYAWLEEGIIPPPA